MVDLEGSLNRDSELSLELSSERTLAVPDGFKSYNLEGGFLLVE